ncbi:13583_t:CDS:1 [Entrophospora sp. SA101]|nr:5123_t:CDS:1 [Entrophospora sp. SA101]CAJ0745194.1 18041_t:CDS:1 [Entrophospora sp. SA101]CAJ0753962.1 16789_t:CDS:1 [Entrophospora sp. SA101]CAJ0761811.1 13583_t:CDS:1 [Entrophospora sp. SA101]CAJ0827161.1 5564_t:CDS:1 [Entrophospora sp. SA101]
MYDDSFYRMLNYHYHVSEYEAEEFCEFVEEYGWRKEWESYYFTYWNWLTVFDMIKDHWNEKEVRQWREKTLQKFIYSLPDIKNPEALLQGFMDSNAFTLVEIISLLEGKDVSNIPYDIWGECECPPSYFENDSEDEQLNELQSPR